jgi:serine/threonine-protein kinase RsbW
MDTLRLPATMESLDMLRTFVLQCASRCGVRLHKLPDIDLVLEELLTNVFHYAYPPDEAGDIEVKCFMEAPARFCLIIQDWGRAFDPLAREIPCVSADVCERPVGGLGIYLVRHKADGVCYQRLDDRNVLKICFNLDR